MNKKRKIKSVQILSESDLICPAPIKRKCRMQPNRLKITPDSITNTNITKNSLKFVQWNCNGIRNKDLFLKQFLFENKPDVLGI